MRRVPRDTKDRVPPTRAALTLLILLYMLGFAGMASIFAGRVGHVNWRERWEAWTQPPVHHPVGYVPAVLPQRLPTLPPAPVMKGGARVIVWQTPAPVHRHHLASVWCPSGMAATRSESRLRSAPIRAAARRYSTAAPEWQRQPRAGLSVIRHPIEPGHRVIMGVPERAVMPTWAHAPDPSLPPECRPKDPVVAGS